MSCYRPVKGYKAPNGAFTFNRKESLGIPMTIPCRYCIGCRLDYSVAWAIRASHEAQLWADAMFVTLTYKELPQFGSLVPWHLTDFWKRLRNNGYNIRYLACGEYGKQLKRPHYHAIIYNARMPDLDLWRIENGQRLYKSPELDRIWGHGFTAVGNVSFESSAYVARYMLKKIRGNDADLHYRYWCPYTGEGFPIEQEFVRASRGRAGSAGNGGLGLAWIEKYWQDVYPHDYVVLENGKQRKPPKFYDNWLEANHNDVFQEVKEKRKKNAKDREEDNTWQRLLARETCHERAAELLHRGYEA